MATMGNVLRGDGGKDELPPKLNPIKEGTFVHYTLRVRWPKTLDKTSEGVERTRKTLIQQYGKGADADVNSIRKGLSDLKDRIVADKPLTDIDDTSYSFEVWNKALAELRKKHGDDQVTWYKMDWLFTETYLYRKIVGCVANTEFLKSFDIFKDQKVEGFSGHLDQIRDSISYLLSIKESSEKQEKEVLEGFLKMCLWGNKCDLSLSCGEAATMKHSPVEAARLLDEFILCNDFKIAIESFFLKLKSNKKGLRELHIVLDNAGVELISDLILSEYLMEMKLVDKTVLHGKEYPYFVSDVTGRDFEWTLAELNKLGGVYQQMYQKLSERVKKNELVFRDHRFWTYFHPYCEMNTVAKDLYSLLSEASIIIMKGDLNYRKLVADREWAYETPFKVALCGFLPAPIFALRSLKSETVTGLPEDVAERMRQEPSRNWMVSGDYGVAELAF
ncbi:unnamed protein product [Cylicocyclus nassatus]|uniref:Sugar phosphate phosphatase n=1 Tax=Cylicocyclus nassatus TaxID=53992 RepID=A0AA36DRQ8_CYLNA|nr:unnamed protein product [Cylicocyclus nassatus]